MTSIDFTARGLARRLELDLASNQPGKGAQLVGVAGGGTVHDQLRGYTGRTGMKALTPANGDRALLIEAGREGAFVFDASDLSVEVAADAAEAIYVAPDSDATGASGAWVREPIDPAFVNWNGATDAADPDGREAYAPALVASLQSRRLYGVELRDLLGRNYNPANDASVAFNGFLAELAPEGIAIRDSQNLTMLAGAPLRPESGMKLLFGPGTTILRGWSAAVTDTNALMARADWSVDTDDFLIEGGVWKPADASQTGRMLQFYGDNWEIRNAQILDYQGESGALIFGGDNIRLNNIRAVTDTVVFGSDAFRMVGGKGMRAFGLYAVTGDDCFAFVPIAVPANARGDLSIEDSYYIGCNGRSLKARLLSAVLASSSPADSLTGTIRNCGWIGCTGGGTRRSLIVENTSGDGTVPRQIDAILVQGCHLDGAGEDNTLSQSAYIRADFSTGVGAVTLRDTVMRNTPASNGLHLHGLTDGEVLLDNCEIRGETSAIAVQGGSPKLTIRGGRYRHESAGGGHGTWNVIDVQSSVGACDVRLEGNPLIEEIASSRAGVANNSTSARVHIESLTANEASGATGTIGLSAAAGSTSHLGTLQGTVDNQSSGAGTVTRNTRGGKSGTLTIASGSVTLTAGFNSIDTEAAAASDDLDTVVFPSWATDGQIFVLRAANAARTVVVKDGTGNIRCAGDRSLDNSEDTFTGIKDGANLVEIGFANNGA